MVVSGWIVAFCAVKDCHCKYIIHHNTTHGISVRNSLKPKVVLQFLGQPSSSL